MSGPNAKMLQADKDIKRAAKNWNENLKRLMKERGMRQTDLASMMNARFCKEENNHQFTQKNVSAWTNVGSVDGKGHVRPFPKFEIMLQIATILEVDLGFLIEEIKCKTYDAQDARDYTGLEEQAIEKIRSITHFERRYRTGSDKDSLSAIISGILESPSLDGLLNEMRDLAKLRDGGREIWESVISEFGEDLANKALRHYDDFVSVSPKAPKEEVQEAEAINEAVFESAGISPEDRKRFLEASDAVSKAMDVCFGEEHRLKLEENAIRYLIQKKFEEIVDSMYPSLFSGGSRR